MTIVAGRGRGHPANGDSAGGGSVGQFALLFSRRHRANRPGLLTLPLAIKEPAPGCGPKRKPAPQNQRAGRGPPRPALGQSRNRASALAIAASLFTLAGEVEKKLEDVDEIEI